MIFQVADEKNRTRGHGIVYSGNHKFCCSAGAEQQLGLIVKMGIGCLFFGAHIKAGFTETVFDQKIFFRQKVNIHRNPSCQKSV